MYNHAMPISGYEIRVCDSCGLRYPLAEGHPYGTRCPACMGTTRVVLTRKLVAEPGHGLPDNSHREGAKTATESNEAGERFLAVLLDNIRSAWNAGSILRSAEGFGFAHAFFCGITPTPENEAVTRASLGAEDSVPWSYHKDAVKLVKGLKQEGWKVYALEEDERAVTLGNDEGEDRKAVLIVGNEVTGVDPELLDLCGKIFFIPMRGEKKSFNAAVAFGIAAHALQSPRRRNVSQ